MFRIPSIAVILFFAFTSCNLPVRVLNDEQIKKHYANRPAKPQLKYIRYKNYHIHHALVGDSTKPLLLIIHGAPGAWYSSMRLLDNPELQKNFYIISVDRLGFGKSNYGVSEPSIQSHVKYLEKIVKEYNRNGKIYVMGSSYGAPIAASFTMQNPNLVNELYLLSPVIDPDTEKIFWFSYPGKIGPVRMFIPEYLNVATDEKFAHRRQLKKLKDNWDQIVCKTYVIMGKKDWIADLSNLEFARKMLVNAKDAEFLLIENTGHSIIWQRTDLLISLLLKRNSFLAVQ